jgi:transposase InsO family protein
MRRVSQRLDRNGRIKARRRRFKPRKPKDFRAQYPGHLIALDTVERIQDGMRRYLLTMTDVASRTSLAIATTSHASRAARDFLALVQDLVPIPIDAVLSDNGSEFQGHFAQALDEAGIVHWHTYPKTPKMNAHVERFNRTIQEDFVDYHEDLLFTDLGAFNEQLAAWLIYYNTVRPHHALGLQTPLQFVAQHYSLCQTSWTHTWV